MDIALNDTSNMTCDDAANTSLRMHEELQLLPLRPSPVLVHELKKSANPCVYTNQVTSQAHLLAKKTITCVSKMQIYILNEILNFYSSFPSFF